MWSLPGEAEAEEEEPLGHSSEELSEEGPEEEAKPAEQPEAKEAQTSAEEDPEEEGEEVQMSHRQKLSLLTSLICWL